MDSNWEMLLNKLAAVLGKRPQSLEAVLFLIGLQKTGKGKGHFSKEEKQDFIHVGMCEILTENGTYAFSKWDQQGWPHYNLLKALPPMELEKQEKFLIEACIKYFKNKKLI